MPIVSPRQSKCFGFDIFSYSTIPSIHVLSISAHAIFCRSVISRERLALFEPFCISTVFLRGSRYRGCYNCDMLIIILARRLQDGSWHQFTGNQLGILLASHVLSTSKDPTVLASTVSSRMLSVMASTSNFQFRETLTGFKWLGNVALQLHAQGHNPVFAFEEAIGYMFPSVVWDKDGIAAAAVFLTACAAWKANGLTPWTRLRQLYEQYGFFEDANTYLVSPSPAVTNAIFAAIRDPQPANLGKRGITRWRDLTVGYDSGTADHKPELPVDAKTQMITCELEDGVRFTVRGSGTEPKIKLYIEASAESSEAAKKSAEEVQEDLFREWFKVGSGNGLRPAGS